MIEWSHLAAVPACMLLIAGAIDSLRPVVDCIKPILG